jgi:hypothetical protein
MDDVSVGEAVQDAQPAELEDRPHRHGGRKLLVLAGAGLLVMGAVWSFTTIRAGIRASEAAADKGRRSRRRRR